MIETAKEKLKGAAQAGLVTGSAAAAVRTAVVRAAATLHAADNRLKKKVWLYIGYIHVLLSQSTYLALLVFLNSSDW